jgi:glucose-1-phosphate adenylyltransferase
MEPNLVILAGGISSRMKRSTSAPTPIDPALRREAEEKAKAMIGVGEGRRPFLDYLLYNVRISGYRDVVIVVGERDDSIQRYYSGEQGASAVQGLSIAYAIQQIPPGRSKPLGTADALLVALRSAPRWHGKRFTVCNSDNLYSRRALTMMLECADPGAMIDYDRSAFAFEHERIQQFAVTQKTEDGYLLNILEKPSAEVIERVRDAKGRVGVSMNIWRLGYDAVLPYLETVPLDPVRNEKELPTAIMMMLAAMPKSIRALPLAEDVPDLTNQADIGRVREYLQREFPELARSDS